MDLFAVLNVGPELDEGRAPRLLAAALVILLLYTQTAPAGAQTINYFNTLPEIQMYSYPSSTSNGPGSVRDRGATFGHYSATQGGQTVYVSGDGPTPSRRGSILLAVDTSDSIPIVEPTRYQINSVKVTLELLGSVIYPEFGFLLPYDNTFDSSEALTTGGDLDAGHPVEMYGIGFQGELQRFGFTAEQTGSEYFRLGDVRWQGSDPYRYFAVDSEGRDVENSVYGGYSATELVGNHTEQFTPAPFAIGKAYDGATGIEFAPGELLETGDIFKFEANLSDPGVVEYIKRSLSEGQLGFGASALHPTETREGVAAYPDFYLDDLDIGPNQDGEGPTFEINLTILPEKAPGDFNSDGAFTGADFLQWQREYGMERPLGWGADGDKNGVVAGGDLNVWADKFGSNAQIGAMTVPEPVVALLPVAALSWSVARRKRRFIERW